MMKLIRNILIVFVMVAFISLFVACDYSRPSFPEQNNESLNTSNTITSSSALEYCNINLCDGVEAKSISLKTIQDKYYVESGSDVKFSITYPKYLSTTGETFYFNENTNKIILGLNINSTIIHLSEINNYFTVNSDVYVSLYESNLTLSALMICEKYSHPANDTLYNKFNYKSDNFRNSLISTIDGKISISDSIHYIVFEDDKVASSNVSRNLVYDESTKALNLKIGTYLETTDIAIAFISQDEHGNLFLSDVEITNNISHDNNSLNINTFSTLDNNISSLNIEFISYYLPSMVF